MPSIDEAIERLYDVNVGITSGEGAPRHERPHKPLLLLAAFDLIDEGHATPDRIPWCLELRDRFTARFDIVRKLDDQDSPENPFLYLRKDGFWKPMRGSDELAKNPLVGDYCTVAAHFIHGFDVLVSIPENRRIMREALISRYFPDHAAGLLHHAPEPQDQGSGKVEEESTDYGRDPAFRRKIIEIYDPQCAACGLRIRLPQAKDISFIDAAHLIPFSTSRNDHPPMAWLFAKIITGQGIAI